jgi:hypothetical protein
VRPIRGVIRRAMEARRALDMTRVRSCQEGVEDLREVRGSKWLEREHPRVDALPSMH